MKNVSSSRYLEHVYSHLLKLDRVTLLFLCKSSCRKSVVKSSKSDIIEIILKEHLLDYGNS